MTCIPLTIDQFTLLNMALAMIFLSLGVMLGMHLRWRQRK